MTIQQLADAHVGHPEEIDEDSVITAQRESFKWGAIHVIKEIETIIALWPKKPAIRAVERKIKELKGDLEI